MKLPNNWYNVLKWVALIALPAVAWFYGAVGPNWGWPNIDAVVNTLNASGALVGILIGVSTASYNKSQKE